MYVIAPLAYYCVCTVWWNMFNFQIPFLNLICLIMCSQSTSQEFLENNSSSECILAESMWSDSKDKLNITQCKNIISIFTVLITCVTVGIIMLIFGFLYYHYYTPPRDLWSLIMYISPVFINIFLTDFLMQILSWRSQLFR